MSRLNFLMIGTCLALASCASDGPGLYLAQGFMSGEVTMESVILQTRLCASDTLVEGDLPGAPGWARFEVSASPAFHDPLNTEALEALPGNDFILKTRVEGLSPNTTYHYRVHYGRSKACKHVSKTGTFRTLAGAGEAAPISLAVVTGMNYYHFHYGNYDGRAYAGPDKHLGYPALEAMGKLGIDYFIGTGDNVYFDHPHEKGFERAVNAGKHPHPGLFEGKEVVDEQGIRKKYHVQFTQPRYRELFARVATYWEKDDHDYRYNDTDPYMDFPISHELGIASFREQLPVTFPPQAEEALTYRTHRMSRDLQVWLLEGRDYRDPNAMEPGPAKSLLGREQLAWLKRTLLESDATFKLIVSPTPMVGPDDMYKSDNHVNPLGFHHEGEALFAWFVEEGFLDKGLYLVCGDRHWKYHATHPSGVEEYSCGALVDNNSRAGRLAGDPASTDPEGLIVQHFIEGSPGEASGGFLLVSVDRPQGVPTVTFSFYDEQGVLLYEDRNTRQVESLIFDSDMGSDCDDVGALALLHHYAREGKAEILGCIYSSGAVPFGAGIIDAINHYYGRGDIPVGACHQGCIGDTVDKMKAALLAPDTVRFGHRIVHNRDAEEQTRLNRRLLAGQEDSSVTYLTVGHTQGLHALLLSEPDDLSPLSGKELIRKKVKRWVALGALNANNPEGQATRDWNFFFNGSAPSTAYLLEHLPVPIELVNGGREVYTGASLAGTPEGNIVRTAYETWLDKVFGQTLADQRSSWDLVTVYYAVEGLGPYFRMEEPGHLEFDAEMGCRWIAGPGKPGMSHAYITEIGGLEKEFGAYLNKAIATP